MGLRIDPRGRAEAALVAAVRLASVLAVQTWYVPDEYWQSLEVAHRSAFGYGALTWEWGQGLRSSLYPAAIAGLYKLAELASLDSAALLIYAPRVFQALICACADYALFRWSGRHKWALFLTLSQWFWFYTASRTLANTLEAALVTLALARYPFRPGSNDNGWLCYATLSVVLRPTSLIIWAPLCVNHLLTTTEKRLRLIALTYLPIIVSIVGLSVLFDSYVWYDRLVVTGWEFVKFNFLNDIGSFYGTQPWYWYFAIGFPVVLGINVVPFALASFEAIKDRHSFGPQRLLLLVTLFTLIVYSLLPHKEFRFILPLVPISTFVAQDFLSRWSRKAKKLWVNLVFGALLLGNLAPSVYFSLIHQRGPLDTMDILRDIATKHPNNSSFLFLMPCHSTPLYSHLHVNVPTRYLTCEPNLTLKPNYKDEAEVFYENPTKWFNAEYLSQQVGETQKKSKLPSHIVAFDTLAPKISNVLPYYDLQHVLFNSHFNEGRVGNEIHIYVRAKKAKAQQ